MELERTWGDGGQFDGRSQLELFARAEPSEHGGQILRADIEVLADAAPEHRRGHVAAAALFLRFLQDVEDDALLASEAIADVGQHVVDSFHVR